jgi:3-oxoacyl-[acyl-carrier protein] reductase
MSAIDVSVVQVGQRWGPGDQSGLSRMYRGLAAIHSPAWCWDAESMSDSDPRIALITGGTRGIGREIATRLVTQGYAVAVAYAGDTASADTAVTAMTAAGGRAIAVQADVADEDAVAALFDTVERELGGVDVVVNAAGIMPLSTLVDLDLADLDRVVRTNLRGTFVVDQQAARRVRAGGAIVNLSSSVTRFANPGNIAYTATKGAVEAITLVLARELRGRDITVNTVAPGAIATEMLEDYFAEHGEEARAQVAGLSPMGRLGTPQDVAQVVAFLAGPGRWVNGQVIYANGGAI